MTRNRIYPFEPVHYRSSILRTNRESERRSSPPVTKAQNPHPNRSLLFFSVFLTLFSAVCFRKPRHLLLFCSLPRVLSLPLPLNVSTRLSLFFLLQGREEKMMVSPAKRLGGSMSGM